MSEARDLPEALDPTHASDLPDLPESTENHTHEETIMTNAQQTPLHDVTGAPSPWQDKPAPKKLTRNTSDKMIAGVCSGLADYLNVDVTIVRLGFVALTIVTGGVGAIAYAAGWIVVPERMA
jgi:phage shock protein PspC (stress-responsive transcriptional regulator)